MTNDDRSPKERLPQCLNLLTTLLTFDILKRSENPFFSTVTIFKYKYVVVSYRKDRVVIKN